MPDCRRAEIGSRDGESLPERGGNEGSAARRTSLGDEWEWEECERTSVAGAKVMSRRKAEVGLGHKGPQTGVRRQGDCGHDNVRLSGLELELLQIHVYITKKKKRERKVADG